MKTLEEISKNADQFYNIVGTVNGDNLFCMKRDREKEYDYEKSTEIDSFNIKDGDSYFWTDAIYGFFTAESLKEIITKTNSDLILFE